MHEEVSETSRAIAMHEGFIARLKGYGEESNPYREANPLLFERWRAGWMDQDATMVGRQFPAVVVFRFENAAVRDAFVGYMSDGGGEQGFFETHPNATFDYQTKYGRVLVSNDDE